MINKVLLNKLQRKSSNANPYVGVVIANMPSGVVMNDNVAGWTALADMTFAAVSVATEKIEQSKRLSNSRLDSNRT